jgi:hypothetical protein
MSNLTTDVAVPSIKTTSVEPKYLDSVPNPEFLYSVRSLGYVNSSAISDIIDNALEQSVKATIVNVNIRQSKGEYKYIEICDNGSGMTIETLDQALRLGSQTGKNRGNLGFYGTGMKSASVSMGLRFEVWTKNINDYFRIAVFDIEEKVENNSFRSPVRIGTSDEYNDFMSIVGGDTGTIIRISKLDNISDSNASQFADTIRKALGKNFKYYIENGITIKVNNQIVHAIDPMYRDESFSKHISATNERFEYDGLEFKFNVYHIPKIDNSFNNTLEISRNQANAGLYIYRNYRLVGSGLDLGIVGKLGDGYLNGVRIELIVPGESDELFGSSLTKMIHEKDKSEIDQGFRDVCTRVFGPYIQQIRKDEERLRNAKNVDIEVKNKLDNIFEGINKNPFIKVEKTKGVNAPNLESKRKPEPTGRKNKFSPRKRDDKWIEHRLVKLDTGEIYAPRKENGLYVIELNVNHPYYSEFLVHLPDNMLGIAVKKLAAEAIALESTGFYSDGLKNGLLSEYHIEISQQLRKLITY